MEDAKDASVTNATGLVSSLQQRSSKAQEAPLPHVTPVENATQETPQVTTPESAAEASPKHVESAPTAPQVTPPKTTPQTQATTPTPPNANDDEPEDPQNPVNTLKADVTKIIKEMGTLQNIENRSLKQDDEMKGKVKELIEKKEELKALEESLEKEDSSPPDVATNKEGNSAEIGPNKEGTSTAEEVAPQKAESSSPDVATNNQAKVGGALFSNRKLEKEKIKLHNLENEADIEIARADVKLIYDYVQKTSEPRALKALFEYQQGRDKKEDTLSKHYKRVEEIRNNANNSPDVIKKADRLLKEIHLARVKLYSVNIDAALRRIEDAEGDVNFFPDELRTEMTEKQKRITAGILVVFSLVKYIFKQFSKAPTIVTIFTLLSLAVVLLSAFLAFLYCTRIVNDYVNNKLINNPTNAESLDFLIANFGNSAPRPVNQETVNANLEAKSKTEIAVSSNPIALFFIDAFKKGLSPLFANMLSAKYKYALFVILPWISVLFGVLAIVFMIRRRSEQLELTPGLVQAVLYATMVQSLIALVANYMIFFYAYSILKGTSFRIDNYNKHVLGNMSQRAAFLAYLQKLPTNSIGISNVTKDALTTLFADGAKPTQEELAKAIFTLNLYEHYQQLGYRNPILYEALESFRIYTFIFSQQNFSPALYLRRRTTLIRDNGEKYRTRLVNIFTQKGMPVDNRLIDGALILSSRMTAEANNLANAFYPEDAMSRFLRMAVMIAIVQFLPFLIFVWLFRNKDLRNGFIDAIRIMLGQKKQMADADIYDQEDQVNQLRDMMRNKKEQEGEKETSKQEQEGKKEKQGEESAANPRVVPPETVPPPPNANNNKFPVV